LENILSFREKLKQLKHYIMINRGEKGKEGHNIIDYEDLIAEAPNLELDIEVNIYDPNSIIFATGTTGFPKAVLKSMAADLYHVLGSTIYYPNYDATFKLRFAAYANLVSLLVAPQFHLGGQSATLKNLIFPGTTVIMRQYDPEKFLRLIVMS
jgi:acyl-coenzyme A synthetase/AMP-(fatty) acid ligase